MPSNDLPPLEECREKALKILEMRPHSVAELRRKLQNKRKFSAEHIETILADFLQVGLLDDRDFARTCCDTLKGAAPIGRRRAQQKLLAHGLHPDLVKQTLDDCWTSSEPDDSDEARALQAARQKWRSLKRQKRLLLQKRQSLARFLVSRGFPLDIMSRILARPEFKTDADT